MPVWRYDLISNGEGPGGLRRNLRQAGPAPHGEAGKVQAWQVEGISGFELSERLRQQGERFRWLMENGEVLDHSRPAVAPRGYGRPAATTPAPPPRVTAPLPTSSAAVEPSSGIHS